MTRSLFIFVIIFSYYCCDIVISKHIEKISENFVKSESSIIGDGRKIKKPDEIIKNIDDSIEEDRQQSLLGLPEEVPEIDQEFASRIVFVIYKNGNLVYNYDEYDRKINTSISQHCSSNGNYTFIIHGWRESSETEWVQLLVSKFTKHRNGCVIAIDYEKLAYRPYSKLLQYFDPIITLLNDTIDAWRMQGMDLNKTHIFGFDYGGRIALKLGEILGTKAIMSIDVCDIAGPGFDDKLSTNPDFREAAQNVQCIHTSNDKGTQNYNTCHQNWRIGVCGYRQIGSDMSPLTYTKYKSSHRICPYYYLLSFDKDFYAQEKAPIECVTKKLNGTITMPENFKMGFLETRKSEVQGELFISKPPQYPFNDLGSNDDESSTISKVMDYYREEIVGYRDSPSTIEQFESSIISAIRGIEPALLSLVIRFG